MKTKIIVHRGASFDAPENTLAAFKLGLKQQAAGIEGDFRYTKDGYVVCMHDISSLRTTGIDLNIEESNYEEIKKLDAGLWKGEKWKNERIPLLSEILSFLPQDKKIYIEIKSDIKIVPFIKSVLDKSSVNSKNIHFISFDMEVVRLVKKEMPHIKAFWLTEFEEINGSEILEILKDINADGIDCKASQYVDKDFVTKMRGFNMELHCWTVDDVETAKRFVELGFDSITTNKPALLLQEFSMM